MHADVRGALGPYLNVFLTGQLHWSQTDVGCVAMLSSLLGIGAHTPAAPRSIGPSASVMSSSWRSPWARSESSSGPRSGPSWIANTAIAVVGDLFGPAVAATALGL